MTYPKIALRLLVIGGGVVLLFTTVTQTRIGWRWNDVVLTIGLALLYGALGVGVFAPVWEKAHRWLTWVLLGLSGAASLSAITLAAR